MANTTPSIMMWLLVLIGLGFCNPSFCRAQPAAPPPPAQYAVELRYEITAPRDQRIVQYRAMIDGLKRTGFEFKPPLSELPPTHPENTTEDRFKGFIDGKSAGKLQQVPFVAAVLLRPANFQLPAKAGDRVLVQLELAANFAITQQRTFRRQTRALLEFLGYVDSVAYDHRGVTGRPFTRLRGTLPVDTLRDLLKDLRTQPTGWFAPRVDRATLPLPFARTNPIRRITVLGLPQPQVPISLPIRNDERFEVIGQRLWDRIKDDKASDEPLRIEIIFTNRPASEPALRRLLRENAPSLLVEGILGSNVWGVFGQPYVAEDGNVKVALSKVSEEIKRLAKLPTVSVIRLPVAADSLNELDAVFPGDDALALKKSGLSELHAQGHRGKGVRIAVVDGDFRGWRRLVQTGRLPKSTSLLDLTIERNVNLIPEPQIGDPAQIGHGAQCAAAAAVAAPDAEFVLIRIDPGAPYLLDRILQFNDGELAFSPNFLQRLDETRSAELELELFRREVMLERRLALNNFEDEREPKVKYEMLGPVRTWLFTTREWHFGRMEEFRKARKSYERHEGLLLDYAKKLRGLRDIDIVACSLVWNDSYPLGARSQLTTALDDRTRVDRQAEPGNVTAETTKPIWFQTAGNARGQTWNGPYRDVNENGAMEFKNQRRRAAELSFVSWQSFAKPQVVELVPGTRLRVSLQWTEPHDQAYSPQDGGKDWYRRPLAELKILVLHQNDPGGKTLPADLFTPVAHSGGLPLRLRSTPTSATYEIRAEWTVAKTGRYAIRIERPLDSVWLVNVDPDTGNLRFQKRSGLIPTGISPLGAPVLPSLEKRWELKPRLQVKVLDAKNAAAGRPVFRDFSTDLGSVGVPADGRDIVAVAAARFDGKTEIHSSQGPPAGLELFVSPRVYAYAGVASGNDVRGTAYGADLAAPFAAGMTAALMSSGRSQQEVRRWLFADTRKRILTVPAK